MDEALTLYGFWMALYRKRVATGVVALSSCALALGISLLLPPVYEAKSSFFVPYEPPRTAAASAAAQSTLLPLPEEKITGVNVGIIKSKDIARRVAALFPDIDADAIARKVDFVIGKEFLVEVYARDRDPKRAAAIANAYVQAYDEFHARAMSQRSSHARRQLELELVSLEQRLIVSAAALKQYQARSSLVSANLDRQRLADLTKGMEAEIKLTDANLAATKKRIDKIEEQLRTEKKALTANEVAVGASQFDTLRNTVTALEIKLSNYASYLDENHPTIKRTRDELGKARRELDAEVEQVFRSRSQRPGTTYEALRSQLMEQRNTERYLEARLKALRGSLAETDVDSREAAPKILTLEQMQQEHDSLQHLKRSVQGAIEETKARELLPQRAVVEVERALPPARPAFPDPVLNAVVALFLGLGAGCYYALFLDYLERVRRERVRRQMDWSLIKGEAA